MRILLTGATGFIGSYVAYEFLNAGHDLIIMARNPEKVPELSEHAHVRRVKATLKDSELFPAAFEGVDACVQIALGWGDTPSTMLQNDTTPTICLLEAAQKAGVKKFIYTSSTAALGHFFPNMSEADPLRPSDLYGATKAASEAYVLAVGARSDMRCNVIRPGYTFGNPIVPGASTQPDRRFHQIAQAAKHGQDIPVQAGDGTQFIWAGDLARLYRALLESNKNREVYYGLGKPFVTWQHVAERAAALAGSASRIVQTGRGDEPSLFNLAKIERDFGLSFDSAPHIDEHLRYLLESAG